MQIKLAPHNSPEYWQAVELRRQVLRLPLGLDFTAEELDAESEQLHLIALEENRIVACLTLVDVGHGIAKMRQVAVDPSRQGIGLGSQLVTASEKFAREKGVAEFLLHARDTAVPFYLRLGYEVIGEEFQEVGIPHRKMNKQL